MFFPVARRTTQVGGGYALQFPSNSTATNTSDPYAVLEFVNPQNDGLPIWGASNAGITMVRRVRTKGAMQVGYTAQIWWSQGDGNFSGSNGYWGCHPYPARGFDVTNDYSGIGHFIHEIAIAGQDVGVSNDAWTTGDNPSAPTLNYGVAVTANTTYVQALRITRNNASSKTLRYYYDLPDTGKVIEWTETTENYGESAPPSPKLTLGDSPWFASFAHERADCLLDSIKIFSAVLSESDAASEAANFASIVTSAGQSAIWWGRNGFESGHDTNGGTILCSYGTGRSFSIVNPSETEAQRINLVSRF